jgi:calcineurin-like phosphoesterase family protein
MINFDNKLSSNDDRGYWITSDLHFYHNSILRFCKNTRPWGNLEEMHEALIAEWNSKVKPDDVIFHLGDFSFSGKEKTENIISQLNGEIVWVLGNHDNKVFQSIKCNKHHYLEVSFDGTKVCMMHYSLSCWNRAAHGSVMLHGHTHGNYQGEGRIVDVGYDNFGKIMKLKDVVGSALQRDIVCPDQRHKR